MARKDKERRPSREYVALKAARETAAKNTRATIQRITRIFWSRHRHRRMRAPSSIADLAVMLNP